MSNLLKKHQEETESISNLFQVNTLTKLISRYSVLHLKEKVNTLPKSKKLSQVSTKLNQQLLYKLGQGGNLELSTDLTFNWPFKFEANVITLVWRCNKTLCFCLLFYLFFYFFFLKQLLLGAYTSTLSKTFMLFDSLFSNLNACFLKKEKDAILLGCLWEIK